MLYLALWLICGLAAGSIYRGKGRPYATAFIVGLLFGPIGVILAAITPADAAGQERRAITSGGAKKCPQCAELIKAEAQVCRFCGYSYASRLSVAPPPPGSVVKVIKSGTVTCSSCGGTVRSDAKNCRHCGKEFTLEHPFGS